MKEAKDRFSGQPEAYRKFRPGYPEAFIRHVVDQAPGRHYAWDCATGNGQGASALSAYFRHVLATDISAEQLRYASPADNVEYAVGRAEATTFPDNRFDLITAGQAAHWFDFEPFYSEVRRVSKPNGILALFGYGLVRVNVTINPLLDRFYTQVVGPYWDPERRHVDEAYRTIPFPFESIPLPTFAIEAAWSLNDLAGYLNTWSSVKKFIAANGEDPVPGFIAQLRPCWPATETRPIAFPLFGRVGVVA